MRKLSWLVALTLFSGVSVAQELEVSPSFESPVEAPVESPVEAQAETQAAGPASTQGLGALVASDGTPSVAALTAIRQALLALKPQSGEFVQRAPNGGLIEGRFDLSLPDKMRFAYRGSSLTVVTVAGPWISVQETPGGEANRYPVSATPLQLLRDSWEKPIDPTHVKKLIADERFVELTLVDGKGDTPGELTLIFGAAELQLRGWQTIDAQGQVTQVALRSVTYVDALPNETFFVDEEEDSE